MDNDQEYWNIEISQENLNDLDPDSFKELNDIDDNKARRKLNPRLIIAVITLVIFSIFIAGNIFRVMNIPDLSFLERSSQLKKNPEISAVMDAVVVITNQEKTGTGFNVSPEGMIITNEHVIRDGEKFFIEFPSGEKFRGSLAEAWPELDLAILSVSGNDLPYLKIGSYSSLDLGEEVLIIGNPLGIPGVVKTGSILGKGDLEGIEEEVILIKGPIHQGSSGSPVFNERREVVAVIFAVLVSKDTEKNEIIGLAIPIDVIKDKIRK